ncbi:pentatricopeptide repeat-containing protein [Tanacetum coccineum]
MKIEESLNVTFDETHPPSKTSPLVDDDLDEEEAINEPSGCIEDENGVVSRNKARLVAQGCNQQEGINYDETYAPVARLRVSSVTLKGTRLRIMVSKGKGIDTVVYADSDHAGDLFDHGTKRFRQSNPSSSSNTLDHSSSSHYVDENIDENDKESSHSNTPSPSQLINSLSNVVPRVFENPPHENQTTHTYQTKILNHQNQHRDEHRKGLRSIGRALKNAVRG